jgi:alpha-galactosidase
VTTPDTTDTIVARRVDRRFSLDAAAPGPAWQSADGVVFSSDWQGHNADPALETKVQLLWFPGTEAGGQDMGSARRPSENHAAALYLRFECRYRELFVFEDCEPNGWRDHLWDRDVAEAFLQPGDGQNSRPANTYSEFEIAPNGMWIDLDISPQGRRDLKSGLSRSVHVDRERKIWMAELAIPLQALVPALDANISWRANFYRIEGSSEPRRYLAWQPTGTPQPNFHVPRAFGILRFEP